MMQKHRIFSLRYSTPLQATIGKVSYHFNLSNPYNMDILRSQARNALKRGLAKSVVKRIPFERVAEEGWNLQRDTLYRQGRLASLTEADWKRICHSAVGLEGFESWAALVDGKMAACVIICRIGDTFYVPYAFSHSKYLDKYVNNAMFFSVSCNLLARDGIKGIFFTVQSLDAPRSVDDFKFRLGLNAKAVRQRVVFNPLLEPFITPSSHNFVSSLLMRYPSKVALAKLEGMIRFYLDGKLPLSEQEWPDCLAGVKHDSLPDPMLDGKVQSSGFRNVQSPSGGNHGRP